MQPPSPDDAGGRRIAGGAAPNVRRLALPAGLALLVLLGGGLYLVLRGHHRHRPPPRAIGFEASASPLPSCGAECDPIDRRFLTDVRFGRSSFWIQPWRAYLDTWPAARLRDALGINFNVPPAQAAAVARLLHEDGFKLARIGIGWDSVSYHDPRKLGNEAAVREKLIALHDYGLRPLIVLNSNSGAPCPGKQIVLALTAPAPAGSRTIRLSPASAAAVVPGRSGLNPGNFRATVKHDRARRGRRLAAPSPALTPEQRAARRARNLRARRVRLEAGLTTLVLQGRPGILITKLSAGGVATLSRPLPVALSSGPHPGTTLRYAPFSAPKLADGSPNPAFAATYRGWLAYVSTVARVAESVVGPGGYDFEIWNELTFGSQFLNAANYAPRPPEKTARRAVREVTKQVVKALRYGTVAYIRNPVNGISPRVGISDGFASETPFYGGAIAPRGLTALSKHPYVSAIRYPTEYHVRSIRPLNALGGPDTASRRSFTPLFTPSFQALLPEYTLTALSTATLIRDVAPMTTRVSRAPHGRYAGPPHQPPLQKWVTEYNLTTAATPVGPDEKTPLGSVALTPADRAHFHTKALLRSLVAMVSKGVSREYFFAAGLGALGLVSPAFYAALEAHPDRYPGRDLGGEILDGFRSLLSRFEGPGPRGAPRQIRLLSVSQRGRHAQFAGDGTAAHPSLRDRDMLAVFPFQASPSRFVIPVYVMTLDLLTLYRPSAPARDVTRFDLPQESFRIELGNLPPGAPRLSVYDPLRRVSTPARLISAGSGKAVIELAATDYPRLLTLDYGAHH
jgi:hypothetical protein